MGGAEAKRIPYNRGEMIYMSPKDKKLFHVTADRPLHFECVVEAATEDDAVALGRRYVDFEMEALLAIPRALNAGEFTVEAIDIDEMRQNSAEAMHDDKPLAACREGLFTRRHS